MSEPSSTVRDPASPSKIRRLEMSCDAYEAAWGAGLRPSIEDHLGDSPTSAHPDLLRELLVLDLAYRIRAGEAPDSSEYRARFPGELKAIDDAFARIRPSDSAGLPEGNAVQGLPDIPGYAVLGELGRGGMGVVFKARPDRLNRIVALKMILAGDLAGPEAAARFLAEAEAVARLQHPQVVQIFRIGDFRGRPFLEMEFVDGGSLADRLDGRPANPEARRPWSSRWRGPFITPISGGSSTATSSRRISSWPSTACPNSPISGSPSVWGPTRA